MKKKGAEPTITQVAQLSGVSIATVSRVINDRSKVRASTAQRVLEAMNSLGYTPDVPSVGSTGSLIIAVLPNLSNPFYAEIINGIQTAAKSRGMDVLVSTQSSVDAHIDHLLRLLKATQASGMILLSSVSNPAVLDRLGALAPLVQCAEYSEQSAFPFVGVDDIAAARSATQALILRGRRRIALLNGPEKFKYARHRYLGYCEALTQAGIPFDPMLVVNATDMGFDSSFALARQMLLSSEPPDAILAASDMYAGSIVRAAQMAGIRIPQDLALISFDNTYIAQFHHPSISSVNIPQFQLGYMACELLLERILNPASTEIKQFQLRTELVLREST